MNGKQLLTVFILILNILFFESCSSEKKESLTNVEIKKIRLLIKNNIKDSPSLKWDFIEGKLIVAAKFSSFEQQDIDIKMLEKVVSKAIHQVLGPLPTEITIVSKPKVQEVTDECPGSNKVLPVRLFINKENKIFSYGSEITEPYLASLFKSLPYGCKDARITFLYEKGASLKYIKRIDDLLGYSSRIPILLEKPTANVIWNWQNSSKKVRVSGTSVEL
ncbi:MAG: hypothetical protein HRU38_25145 [Saccharospirillaceae bacterium]|nr:hypothetical protein [Saccharospirillaceae bacterium]